ILSLEIFSNNTQVINLHRKFNFSIVQEFFIKKQKILKMSLKQSDCKALLS
ncbi:UDP-4-amino-4,6-dideoxy-N-acetyl-beta-L-altrosamine N-acetyltransferase, partial [Campylobacter coli]|nr:UDP-4-amino-4,6-dideoxy-N-acetyl-beta-L-altrosamine N-acetyltransferase [Campylobacter coli]EAK4335974.1 UDP-4-amino-4,6-dideoxy-N-acetyl-beta-L-altrosamine N-acetyltransferase [Campylobacter coli]